MSASDEAAEVARLRQELAEAQAVARTAGRLLAASECISASRSTRRRWQEKRLQVLRRLGMRQDRDDPGEGAARLDGGSEEEELGELEDLLLPQHRSMLEDAARCVGDRSEVAGSLDLSTEADRLGGRCRREDEQRTGLLAADRRLSLGVSPYLRLSAGDSWREIAHSSSSGSSRRTLSQPRIAS